MSTNPGSPEGKLVITVPAKLTGPAVWEKVGEKLDRCVVPGGWLYKTSDMHSTGSITTSMTFVPTPKPEFVPSVGEKVATKTKITGGNAVSPDGAQK